MVVEVKRRGGIERESELQRGMSGLESEPVVGMLWDNDVGVRRGGVGMVKGSGGDGPDVKDSCIVM